MTSRLVGVAQALRFGRAPIRTMASVRFDAAPKGVNDATEVLYNRNGYARTITLNRPKALNALNLPMIRETAKLLDMLEREGNISKVVVLQGVGSKAFCAGGDVRAIAEAAKKGDSLAKDFFAEEYKVNYTLGTYPKPIVAFMDGITMGGGVGLSVHGHFRIATENTMFAMPETAIGLFPDVGGSFFLPRMDGELGMYLALTGHRLKGIEVFKAGIATHYVASNMLASLEDRLANLTPDTMQEVAMAIDEYTHDDVQKPMEISNRAEIDKVFNAPSVDEIFRRLEKMDTEWSTTTLDKLKRMSPLSLKVTFEQLRRGKKLSFNQCFQMEYRLTQRICNPARPDFFEGVRAVLIDKDQKPVWNPKSITEISSDTVKALFEPLNVDRDGVGELKLPDRGTYTSYPVKMGLPSEKLICETVKKAKIRSLNDLATGFLNATNSKLGVQAHVDEVASRLLTMQGEGSEAVLAVTSS